MTLNEFARNATIQDIKNLGYMILNGSSEMDYGTYNLLVDEFNFYHKWVKLPHIINNLGKLEMR